MGSTQPGDTGSKNNYGFHCINSQFAKLSLVMLEKRANFDDLCFEHTRSSALHHFPVHPARKAADQLCAPADFPTVQWCSRSIWITSLLRL